MENRHHRHNGKRDAQCRAEVLAPFNEQLPQGADLVREHFTPQDYALFQVLLRLPKEG